MWFYVSKIYIFDIHVMLGNMSVLWFAVRFIVRDMRFKKFTTVLTILAIASGIAALIALRTVSIGARTAVMDIIEGLFAGELVVYGEGLADIPETVAEEVSGVPGVVKAIPVVWTIGYTRGALAFIFGVRAEDLEYFVSSTIRGRGFYVNESDVCLVEESFAEENGIGVGDWVFVKPQVSTVDYSYRVVGVVSIGIKLQGFFGRGAYVVVPLRSAQEMLEREGYVSMILVKVGSESDVEKVREAILARFPGAQVYRREEMLSGVTKILGVVDGLLFAVAAIGVTVAVFGTSNTVMSSVREHAREIAILRSIGAKASDVALVFTLEAAVFGALGGLLGAVLGLVGADAARGLVESAGLFKVPLIVSPEIIVLGVVSAIVVSVASSIYPVMKAVRVKPIEVLKNE